MGQVQGNDLDIERCLLHDKMHQSNLGYQDTMISFSPHFPLGMFINKEGKKQLQQNIKLA